MKRRLVDFERDYERLYELQRQSWKINFPGFQFYEDQFRSSLRSAARRGEVFLYENEDDELIGWLWLDFSLRRTMHIHHIQVAEPYWGQGIGRKIMEDAIALCASHECRALTLNVTKSNARAMALYAHLGFKVVEDRGDRQYMRLDLPAPSPRGDGRAG